MTLVTCFWHPVTRWGLPALVLLALAGPEALSLGAEPQQPYSADSYRIDTQSSDAPHCSTWLFEPIALLDEPYRVPVQTNDTPDTVCNDFQDWTTDHPQLLFQPIASTVALHPSFDRTCELCDLLAYAQDTGDYASIDGDIRDYLNDMSQLPPVQYALAVTGTTVEDLYVTWFGVGQGFEHAICGEKDELDPVNIGGYHFWYRFYQEERRSGEGRVNWRCTLEGQYDPGISTIRFDWNPLGRDDYRRKPIGGFTIGDSPAALLALGHLAVWRGCDVAERENDFIANINGTPYEWVLVTRLGSLHTLYPKAHDRTLSWSERERGVPGSS